jgi:hypothetical protein
MCFVLLSKVDEIECLNIGVAPFARIEDMNIVNICYKHAQLILSGQITVDQTETYYLMLSCSTGQK